MSLLLPRTAFIHTSDRINFKRCRRRWNWQSPLRQNLQSREKVLPLWFGTGWHFVLEDRYGSRLYGDSHLAWDDYIRATVEFYGLDMMPPDIGDARILGHQMIDYYDTWLIGRQDMETFVYEGVPQTEVNFKIPIPVRQEVLDASGYDYAYYQGTIDRIAVDEYGMLWICEYKTAKAIQKAHFLTDPQVTSYCWAAQQLYGQPIAGCVYMQWKKEIPNEPLILRNGKLSLNRAQKITHRGMYEALRKIYGDPNKATVDEIEFLNWLAASEQATDDGFVSWERLSRNQHSIEAEGTKILLEVDEMLDPNLPLYPNPTRDCVYMCPFKEACINMDDGSDFEETLEYSFASKHEERGRDPWRQLLRHQMPVKEMELQLPPQSLSLSQLPPRKP